MSRTQLTEAEKHELRIIRPSYIRDGYAVRKFALGVLLTDAGKAALR